MYEAQFLLTGTPSDVEAFLGSMREEPLLSALDVSDPQPSLRNQERVGHVELVDVLIQIGQGVAAKAAYDALKAGFERFRRGRRSLRLDELPTTPSPPVDS
ncbi:MAG TPA: hypothetical protein VF529_14285 [Solirubrobacteraceae bacterium]